MSNSGVITNPVGFQAFFPGTVQNVSISGSSVRSSAFQATTTLIRVLSDQDCYVAFGDSPTATSSSMKIKASAAYEYLAVIPGQKVAVLQVSTNGTLQVVEGL